MALQQITEGKTGQEAANIIYQNDQENATAAAGALSAANNAQTAADNALTAADDAKQTAQTGIDGLEEKLYSTSGSGWLYAVDTTKTEEVSYLTVNKFFLGNQTLLRGFNITNLSFNISTAGTLSIYICTDINTTASSITLLKSVQVSTGVVTVPLNITLAENESIGFGSENSTAKWKYDKTVNNPIYGGMYYYSNNAWTFADKFNLNVGVGKVDDTKKGDIIRIDETLDALISSISGGTGLTHDLTIANYPSKSNVTSEFVNSLESSYKRKCTGVSFLSTFGGTVSFFKLNTKTGDVVELWAGSVPASNSMQKLGLEFSLEINELLGTRANINYRNAAPAIGMIAYTEATPSWEFYPNFELAYYAETLDKPNGSTSDSAHRVTLFETGFASLNGFSKSGTWNITENGVTPTGTGAYLTLERVYNTDNRDLKIRTSLKSNSFIKIPCSYGGINAGTGASCFGIDFVSKKIIIYATGNGSDDQTHSTGYTTNILKSEIIPDSFIKDGDYIIEVGKRVNLHILTLRNALTGESVSVTHDGWGAGCQHEKYNFLHVSGGVPTIKYLSVSALNRPDLIFVGDSITDGAFVIPRSQRYGDILRSDNPELKVVISARSGGTINDVLGKFSSEYNIYRPKKMSVMIGTNGGNTVEKLNQLKAACDAIGCKLYLHHVTCASNNRQIAINEMIEGLNFGDSCRLDIATAKNYDPAQSLETSLFAGDGLHPNAAGNVKMAERFYIDTPDVFY